MKISTIELNWFRGAGERVYLDTGGKSVVIYGDNATGKSSFADAFEFIIRKGRILHLQHEYAREENSIINTAAPTGAPARAIFEFDTGEYVSVLIPSEETNTYDADPPEFLGDIQSWQIAQHLLRQDEIANFIKKTKSDKYSALSPLLGLDYYEQIADNISLINNQIVKESKLEYLKGVLSKINDEIKTHFPSLKDEEVQSLITKRITEYDIEITEDIFESVKNAEKEIDKRLNELEPEIRKYATFKSILRINIVEDIDEYLKTYQEAEIIRDEILEHKINILEESSKLKDIYEEGVIECPACGREIALSDFKAHIETELVSLNEYRKYKRAIMILKTIISRRVNEIVILANSDEDFKKWLETPNGSLINESLVFFKDSSIREPGKIWAIVDLIEARKYLGILSEGLANELKDEPKEAVELSEDRDFLLTAMKIPEYYEKEAIIEKITILQKGLDEALNKLRGKISEITKATLDVISDDVRRIWSKLHPREPIENISLMQSKRLETAIDISLQFYGKILSSPRLTLSEGYRNSLGLSIFLALANQEDSKDHPIILDDIVSSIDSPHRGMILDVLIDEFADRQIILLTHDDTWYKRLLIRLRENTDWDFFRLLPWAGPEVGIRLVPTHYTFQEASDLLEDNPRAAGNAVRSIMDTSLPFYFEKLELMNTFIWGPRNDDRANYEYLIRLISEGKTRYQIMDESGEWKIYEDAISCWDEARELLTAWANPASHGRYIAPAEVTRLIDVCERALNYFTCPDCNTKIWRMKDGDKKLCRCRKIRWK